MYSGVHITYFKLGGVQSVQFNSIQFNSVLFLPKLIPPVLRSRVGVSDLCPQKYLFHNSCDVIITSQMAVSELVDNGNDNVLPLAIPIVIFLTVN